MVTAEAAMVIRAATEADLDRVVSLLRAANAEFERVVPATFYSAYLAGLLDIQSRLRHSDLLVADQGGHLTGAITLYPDASQEGWGWPPEWTGIRAVAVAPVARRLGVGCALAQACIERSRALGAQAVCLHTASFMQSAIAMYERLGFRRVPEFDADAGALFGAAVHPAIAALAYRLDLSQGEEGKRTLIGRRKGEGQ